MTYDKDKKLTNYSSGEYVYIPFVSYFFIYINIYVYIDRSLLIDAIDRCLIDS